MGNAYHSLGQYKRALNLYEQSLEISREIEYREGEGASLNSFGIAYLSLGQYKRAIEFYEQSLEIAREIKYRQAECCSFNSLGLAYQSLGQYKQAIEFYKQSLEIAREIKYRQAEATSLSNLGITYYQISTGLRTHFTKMLPNFLIFLFENSLFIFWKFYLLRQAEATLRASLEIHEALRFELVNNDHQISIFEIEVVAYRNLQKVLVAQTKYDEALEIAEMGRTRAFVQLLKQNLLTNDLATNEVTNTLSIARIQQIAQQKNSTIIEYSIIDSDNIYIWVIQPNGNITHRAANLELLTQQNQSLKQIILKTRVSIGVDETDDEGNKIKIESKYNRDETGNDFLRNKLLDTYGYPLGKSLHKIIKKLILDLLPIESIPDLLSDETDDKNKTIHLESEYRRDIEGGYPLLKLLHQILIEPIADLLPTDPDYPIIFIPHYELFLVPFTALQSANNRYLIEDHTILTAPSIQVLEQTSQHQENIKGLRQAALIVGDPTIAAKFQENPYDLSQLPRAKEAAEAIATILQTTAISGENATKAAILDQMLNTRIVHLSAHGLLDDFQGSGIPGTIILAASGDDDGALNAAEILKLKLNSELVVLSACSTGRGTITGDGVNGLSRCFILAGVPSIIVSLWNMGAISAKLLMTEFYQNLARGDNRAAALRYAMLTTKKRFTSPIAWAAFTLIGETASLPLETQQIDLRRLKMSLPDDIKPEEIVAGLSKLLKISDPELFVEHLSALEVGSTDNVNIVAQKIRDWCETRPEIEENLENEIYQQGARGTSSYTSEETVNDFGETLENQTRLRLSLQSVPVVKPDDSGTKST